MYNLVTLCVLLFIYVIYGKRWSHEWYLCNGSTSPFGYFFLPKRSACSTLTTIRRCVIEAVLRRFRRLQTSTLILGGGWYISVRVLLAGIFRSYRYHCGTINIHCGATESWLLTPAWCSILVIVWRRLVRPYFPCWNRRVHYVCWHGTCVIVLVLGGFLTWTVGCVDTGPQYP